MVTGGVTAFAVSKSAKKETRTEQAAFAPGAATHFTSYVAQEYPDLTYAAENAVKGVVNIEITGEVRQQRGMSPFDFFFGVPEGYNQPQQPREQVLGGGSGVIISQDGYIVTNNHVVKDATKLKVTLEDGRTFDAKVIGTDPTTDIALVKVEGTSLPVLPFGDSDALRLGEWVLAIGSPYNLNSTVTAGIVSAKARSLGAISSQNRLESFIQTDAAVNQGNSGGALVNTAGELVGINTLITSRTGGFVGYSFAVPSNIVKKVITDLREHGVVQRAMLGVTYMEVNDEFIRSRGEETGITEKGGIYVEDLDPEGAAKAAGVKKGDVITHFNGVALNSSANLSGEIGKLRPNDKASITVKRGKEVKQFDVILRNKLGNTDVVNKDATTVESLGGQFAEITPKAAKELKIQGGVQVVSVEPGGILAQARVQKGYIITQINEKQISSIYDLDRIASKVEYIEGVYPNGKQASYTLAK